MQFKETNVLLLLVISFHCDLYYYYYYYYYFTFMQVIYSYIPETNNFCRVYTLAAIL
jgi:hypothetical protein